MSRAPDKANGPADTIALQDALTAVEDLWARGPVTLLAVKIALAELVSCQLPVGDRA